METGGREMTTLDFNTSVILGGLLINYDTSIIS